MKKIFAIALALVMVLSMASAFASACVTGPFDWACSTDATLCGKGSVEVVPYVKVNNACGGYDWEVSTCAGAVNSENVYYAFKLTVDADADPEWWAEADLTIEADGVKLPAAIAGWDEVAYFAGAVIDGSKDKDVTYYLAKDGSKWGKDEDAEDDIASYIFTSKVTDADEAEVCITLASDFVPGTVTVGDYKINYVAGKSITVSTAKGEALVKYTLKDEKVTEIKFTAVCGEDDYAAIKAFMGLEIGTCVTDDAIEANFGWDEEIEDCFAWSDKVASIVDAECVVAIPKTGDASVLAWLF